MKKKISSPYRSRTVRRYLDAGWPEVFPLIPTKGDLARDPSVRGKLLKSAPPVGVTGNHVKPLTATDHKRLQREWPMANIGIRMSRDRVCIDVDQYGEKDGVAQLAEIEGQAGVTFPPTLRLTSRGQDMANGGKLIYRLAPEHQGLAWPGKLRPGVDILQEGHRYAMTAPSRNPDDNGRMVRWYRNNTELVPAHEVPHISEAAYLPAALVEAITKMRKHEPLTSADMTVDETHEWVAQRPDADGEPCSIMATALRKGLATLEDEAGGHDTMIATVMHLVRLANEGHGGLSTALQQYRAAWIEEARRESKDGTWAHPQSGQDAGGGYRRALLGAIKKVVGTPDEQELAQDRCSCWPVSEDNQLQVPAPTSEWDYSLDDYGASQRFVDTWRGSVLWMVEREEWYIWQESDETAGWTNKSSLFEVRKRLQYVTQLWAQEAEAHTAEARRLEEQGESGEAKKVAARAKAVTDHVRRLGFAARVASTLEFVSEHPDVQRTEEQFDADPRILVCPNGTVELNPDGAEFRETRPDDYTVKTTATPYDPDALGRSAMWKDYLDSFIPDTELRRYIQKVLGYGLLGANPERLMVFLMGPTSTGKTTINEMLMATLGGSYSGAIGMNIFRGNQDERGRADIMDAYPLHIATASESSAAWSLHADQMKRMVGEDTVPARRPYGKKIVQARMKFLPVIATNAAPRMAGFDAAMMRRLVVVPFEHQAALSKDVAGARQIVQDSRAAERMRQDAEARADFLAWLVEGYELYALEGLEDAPNAVHMAKMNFVSGISAVRDFVNECCEMDSPDDAITRVTDLYEVYKCHHLKYGDRHEKIVSMKDFSMELGGMAGIVSARPKLPGSQNKINVKKGIRINSEWAGIAMQHGVSLKVWTDK